MFMMEIFFCNTIRRMKQAEINEFPLHGVFIERVVDDWIHRQSNYILLCIFLQPQQFKL